MAEDKPDTSKQRGTLQFIKAIETDLDQEKKAVVASSIGLAGAISHTGVPDVTAGKRAGSYQPVSLVGLEIKDVIDGSIDIADVIARSGVPDAEMETAKKAKPPTR